jgi:hypothetical protein
MSPRTLYLCVAIPTLCSRQRPSEQTGATPTATEIFDLRSKCAALGQKIMEGNAIGNALTQDVLSHYNSSSNRCYVKLSVHTADLTTPLPQTIDDEYLYDGQTGEFLLAASSERGRKFANIMSDSFRTFFHDPVLPTYVETDALIDKFMVEERKP